MSDLVVVWGGQPHPIKLGDGEHSVGRASDNAVQIPATRVSKRHAMIRIQGDQLFVRDLGSTNGTEVNGQRVGGEEMEVPEGGTVSFAGALLRRSGTASTAMHSIVTSDEVSARLRYNIREGYSAAARDRILEVSSELFELLASGEDAGEIETAACRFVSQCVAADRVVLLAGRGEATTDVEIRGRWTRKGDDSAPLQLSSTLVGQVMRERESVLVANPLEDPRYTEQKSIMALNLRSAMAVPLFDNERVRGILYVDTADPRVQYGKDDLQVLTATANAVAVKLRNLTLESEMRTAALIQRAMLPSVLDAPPGFEFEAYQVMCREVGGDLYHCVHRPDGTVLLALGDVSGKGTPAALAMSAATVLIGLLAEIGGDLKALAQHLHRQLYRAFVSERFITLFVGELDGSTGRLRYVNAGHEPPWLVRDDGSRETLDSTGMAMAMVEDLFCDVAEVTLRPGDLLAVFTDGITEATADGTSFLGLEPVKEILGAHHRDTLPRIREKIVSAVSDYLKGEPASDDVTLMLLRRSPTA
ncbi:MAG: SpoIIE family protein phosphatase [Candidatus Krumholzibacteria bacterium]|nr:SpoIIE family protein phosphatase [Candidatus Krumholzibacteria bacterium]